LPGLHLLDVRFVEINPNPCVGCIGDGEELGRRLNRLAFDGVPENDGPVDWDHDTQEVPRVLGLEYLGQFDVSETKIPELLLGVHHARLGLVENRHHFKLGLSCDGPRACEGLGALGRRLGELRPGLGRDVLSLCRRHLGRVDDAKDVVLLDRPAKVNPQLSNESRDSRRDIRVVVRVVSCLGISNEPVGVGFLGHLGGLDTNLVREHRGCEPDGGERLSANLSGPDFQGREGLPLGLRLRTLLA